MYSPIYYCGLDTLILALLTLLVGKVEVVCEGYKHPQDEYILRGSCGLEYTLEYTRKGKKESRRSSYGSRYDYDYDYDVRFCNCTACKKGCISHTQGGYSTGGSWGGFFSFLISAVLFYALFKTCAGSGDNAPPPGTTIIAIVIYFFLMLILKRAATMGTVADTAAVAAVEAQEATPRSPTTLAPALELVVVDSGPVWLLVGF